MLSNGTSMHILMVCKQTYLIRASVAGINSASPSTEAHYLDMGNQVALRCASGRALLCSIHHVCHQCCQLIHRPAKHIKKCAHGLPASCVHHDAMQHSPSLSHMPCSAYKEEQELQTDSRHVAVAWTKRPDTIWSCKH